MRRAARPRSSVSPRASKARAAPAGIGLALAGGGFLGAAYELGALAALAESVEGLDLNRLDVYVGVSAGGFIAAALANGKTPHQMVRMFVEDAEPKLDPATLLRPAARLWLRTIRAAPALASQALEAGMSEGLRGTPAVLWQALERVGRMLPNGLLDSRPAERVMASVFSEPGRTDDFRELGTRLRIVATDIDSGTPVAFGSPGFDDVPISRAVRASSALPGLFPPVRIGDRHYVDGVLNKTVHASVALDHGVGLLLCVNPLVPFAPSEHTRHGSVARASLPVILAQSMRTAIRSRMSVGLAKYAITHPRSRIVLFEPRPDDETIFFTRIFTVASRRRVCERAYQQTRADLLAGYERYAREFAAAGLRLRRDVLEDSALKLVRTTPVPVPRRAGGLEDGTVRLSHALDDLERSLRISGVR